MIRQKGFGLAETLIASVLLAFLAVSFFALNSSIRTNIKVGNARAVAAELAQQELENLRFQVGKSWNESRKVPTGTASQAGSWDEALNGVSTGSQNIATIDGVVYSRIYSVRETTSLLPNIKQGSSTVGINDIAEVARRVKVKINWSDGSRARSYELYGLITDWRPGLL